MAEIRYITTDGQPPNGGLPLPTTFPQAQPQEVHVPGLVPIFAQAPFPQPLPQPPASGLIPVFAPAAPPQGVFFQLALLPPTATPPVGPTYMVIPQTQQPAQQFVVQQTALQLAAVLPPPTIFTQGPNPQTPHGAMIPGTANPLIMPGGQGYIFPPDTTTIHLLNPRYHYPWEDQSAPIQFTRYQVSTRMTVAELIRQLCPSDAAIRGRGLVECLQQANANMAFWVKGEEYFVGEGRGEALAMRNKVGQSLQAVGWNEHRTEANPVWLVRSLSLA
ncbi:uncharacterized protein PADG_08143 [Paracoccidioides brasiliensis Pb18]|uniref:Uncharacterized protein n=1 Tax=Paracoccidioides brasiliensis (strain Pb18) TaxID=502780 RepID=C1GM57_PARBD|nr:uncharacterized protein PADG_08143 [Paracoccidioides brasiliensis Pb18]EEH43523.2 hypothetical protein PADG_08143 [Paracoccidioides brasiliensis Pb18]ODH48581.1 hypothetical protein GX48_05344 [Paracoccidioides brasiliensis]